MPPGMLNHVEQKVAVLRHFHKLGYTLRDCMHPQRMGRFKLATLLRAAEQAGIFFPDRDEIAREVREAKERR